MLKDDFLHSYSVANQRARLQFLLDKLAEEEPLGLFVLQSVGSLLVSSSCIMTIRCC